MWWTEKIGASCVPCCRYRVLIRGAACMDQVAVRVDALGSELDQIKSSFDGKSKGRHDSIKIQAR